MEKSSYESYEYINTTENDTNQFFVVQNDGTFLNGKYISCAYKWD